MSKNIIISENYFHSQENRQKRIKLTIHTYIYTYIYTFIYTDIGVLSYITKVNERCMQEQFDAYFSHLLPKYQRAFRQGCVAYIFILVMIKSLLNIRDKKNIYCSFKKIYQKSLTALIHLLLAKLTAFGFDRKSFIFVFANSKKTGNQNQGWNQQFATT